MRVQEIASVARVMDLAEDRLLATTELRRLRDGQGAGVRAGPGRLLVVGATLGRAARGARRHRNRTLAPPADAVLRVIVAVADKTARSLRTCR